MRTISRQDELLRKLKRCLGTIQGDKNKVNASKSVCILPHEKVRSRSIKLILKEGMSEEKKDMRQSKIISKQNYLFREPSKISKFTKQDYNFYKQNHKSDFNNSLKNIIIPSRIVEGKQNPYQYTQKNTKKYSYLSYQQKYKRKNLKTQYMNTTQKTITSNTQNQNYVSHTNSPLKQKNTKNHVDITPHYKPFQKLKTHQIQPSDQLQNIDIKPLFNKVSRNTDTINKLNKINELNQRINKRIFNIVNTFGHKN